MNEESNYPNTLAENKLYFLPNSSIFSFQRHFHADEDDTIVARLDINIENLFPSGFAKVSQPLPYLTTLLLQNNCNRQLRLCERFHTAIPMNVKTWVIASFKHFLFISF